MRPISNGRSAPRADAGQPDSFDYLCIHPYEVADEIAHPNGEVPYLWMTQRLRQALKNAGSKKVDAPVWITEVGRRLDGEKDQRGRRRPLRGEALHDGHRPGHPSHPVV